MDVDLSKTFPSSLWVKRKDYGFLMDISYEKLPMHYSYCCAVGHARANRRVVKGKHMMVDGKRHQREEYDAGLEL